jgi:hypothetical protein
MKKKLLITLGDSWTYGIGCGTKEYGTKGRNSFNSDEEWRQHKALISKVEKKYSWPSVCSNLLDSDLINLGAPALSNPVLTRQLIYGNSHVHYKDIYDKVIFIFMLTDPYRFGLFTNDGLQSITVRRFPDIDKDLAVYKETNMEEPFFQLYMNKMVPSGARDETIFNLQCVEYFCKSCGYDFYWGTAFTRHQEISLHYKNVESCLHYNEFDSFKDLILNKHNTDGFSPCAHPNEIGYDTMARYIANKLR